MKKILISILLCSICYGFSPESRIYPNKGESINYFQSSNFRWIPDKYALRCGDIDYSYGIGNYSVAFGKSPYAIGQYSMAWGYMPVAMGDYSTAWGESVIAGGYASTAWGQGTDANGDYSTTWGQYCIADGNYATAWGLSSNAQGAYSTVWGSLSKAINSYATAWGVDCNAGGEYSTAWGLSSTASGSFSTAFGDAVIASGRNAVAWGVGGIASADNSTVWGIENQAKGICSTAFGIYTIADVNADYSTIFGWNTTLNTPYTFAIGFDGLDFTVKHNEINFYDCNVITTGTFEVGTAIFGDDVNYTEFEPNGTMVMHGEATVWDDLRIIPSAFDKPSSAYPALVDYRPTGSGTTFKVYEFAKSDYAFFTCQLPHGYKVGSDIYCHVHWTPAAQGNEEIGKKVDWKLDYSWSNIGGTFPASTTIDMNDAVTGTDDYHEMTSDAVMDGHTAPKNISSILICKIYRDTTYDTWTATGSGNLPVLLEVDFHLQMDSIASRQRASK